MVVLNLNIRAVVGYSIGHFPIGGELIARVVASNWAIVPAVPAPSIIERYLPVYVGRFEGGNRCVFVLLRGSVLWPIGLYLACCIAIDFQWLGYGW